MAVFLVPLFALISLNGYAWSENIGWIKFDGPASSAGTPLYQVKINEETGDFSGYGWSENIGWIKFSGDYARACSATAGGDCATSETSENTSGWDGLIKLTTSQGDSYGVRVAGNEEAGCYLDGYAWGSDVVGWVHFNGPAPSAGGPKYRVNLSKCFTLPEPEPEDLVCTFNAAPRRLIAPQRSTRLTWSCRGADECSITPGIGVVTPSQGSLITRPIHNTLYRLHCENKRGQTSDLVQTVTVIRSRICETIPFYPGCPQ